MWFYRVRWQGSLYYLLSELNTKSKGILNRKWFIQSESVRGKGDPPFESQGLDWTPLLSKLLLREEPRCGWIQNWP